MDKDRFTTKIFPMASKCLQDSLRLRLKASILCIETNRHHVCSRNTIAQAAVLMFTLLFGIKGRALLSISRSPSAIEEQCLVIDISNKKRLIGKLGEIYRYWDSITQFDGNCRAIKPGYWIRRRAQRSHPAHINSVISFIALF